MNSSRIVLRGCLIDNLSIFYLKRNRTTNTYTITGGIEQEIIKMYMDGLNADLIPIPESSLKKKGDIMFGPCLRELGRNKVDFAIGCIPVNLERTEHGDPSHSYFNMDVRVVTKIPEALSNLDVFVKPFTLNVWISVIMSLFVVSLVAYFIYKREYSYSEQFFSMFAELVQQGAEIEASQKDSIRIFYIFYSLATLLLTLSYMSVILSFMMIPRRGMKIDDNEKLLKVVNEGKHRFLMNHAFKTLLKIMHGSQFHTHRELAQHVTANKWMKNFRWYETPKIVKQGDAIAIPIFMQKIFLSRGTITSKDHLHDGPLVIYYRKNFPHKKRFNTIILRACAAGLFIKLTDDYSFRLQIKIKNNVLDEPAEEVKSLTLPDMQGAFVLLFMGYAISLMSCGFEMMVGKCRMRKDRKTDLKKVFAHSEIIVIEKLPEKELKEVRMIEVK